MESQQLSIRDENKVLLRSVTAHFAKSYNYANKIVLRLAEQGITITRTQVYNCVGGDTYHAEIAKEIALLGQEYLEEQQALKNQLSALNRELEAIA